MQTFTHQAGTWKWGVLGLLFLAPFFFLTYGFANQYAAGLSDVPSIVFSWEKHIPLWAWTIVPYWSIDLFYGLSLLLCWNKFELKQHVLRLFSAQLISISCFLLFPLKFTFERPELHGFFGLWFDILMGFDKPFNQAPSLHIVLLMILWDFYRRHVASAYRWIVHLWSFLIGLSVLTTWQHHFIDIPTGIWVGAFCLWLFPLNAISPIQAQKVQRRTHRHLKFASYYLIAAAALAFLALYLQGWALWLAYPAGSFLLVAGAYALNRPHFFQKQADGSMSIAAWILFAPYFYLAKLNSRLWTRSHSNDSLILSSNNIQIFLGRIPSHQHAKSYSGLFDCCAELPLKQQQCYQQYLSLDLIPLQPEQLHLTVQAFDQFMSQQQAGSKVLIFCALGYSRSSSILAAWLIQTAQVDNVDAAIRIIRQARPWIVLNTHQLAYIDTYQKQYLQQVKT
ncbi:phosphatase PAP2/dual specificity phosphatase family protein [Acinetobacter zhairhuonensis]|uniref:phosphatase PAP2/dual specificity phosphatase family protein n=1 Tax=Acinetobacter sp. A7.4 TaxID=2919921 RepID=UPI001F4DFBA1|nr:phosphatase PAP2/dual specificity phosphatase family protein [Acinetobacter sp. A7.4]MCJ8160759.1 phosphatase PAP2/dual specificity phosphatase family protein [Acinetobacter sp. A7.4]